LSREAGVQLFKFAHALMDTPMALPRVLQATNWADPWAVREMYYYLPKWRKMEPIDYLELLDGTYPDPVVRELAVSCMELLPDTVLTDHMLQVVQSLKHEAHHDSPLSRFLVKRAMQDPNVGQTVFWALKSELHLGEVKDRYGAMLEAYLNSSTENSFRLELFKQNQVLTQLNDAAMLIKLLDKEERLRVLRDKLEQMTLPNTFQLPLNPKMEAKGIRVQKCKYMDSKKLPLWVVFENAHEDGGPVMVMHKVGDDLRQDALTLQMMNIMDRLWQSEGLDLSMSIYGCVATGDEQGMLQIVQNSDTISNVQKGAGGAVGAFKLDPIANWFKENKPPDLPWDELVLTFVKSCAAYCVATYVLGIGDRHNDNIMVSKFGHFFHIDFGHFLGNIKRKFGVKRERAPFVFTPDLAFVMGGKDSEHYRMFLDLSTQAYLLLRRHSRRFMTLFKLMICAGIPELRSVDDITYERARRLLTLLQVLTGGICLGFERRRGDQEMDNSHR